MNEEEKNIFSNYWRWQEHIKELNIDTKNNENNCTICGGNCSTGCGGEGCASCG